ncbi:S41 family peptidase [Sediminibacterium sp. TEGAF015]|uniref:S41 family peptidase n=1 Tax=Sediminibacterium sp. TEGAF015 TaxID=575378 RepID=UPI0021FECDD7|nr:S41 family peptidase [Sediminibacterium sp. TEGAF015]BDQ13164.1 hypothetical protein TEGAF0_23810 [Sediminibacterium sp. TEGAF015]
MLGQSFILYENRKTISNNGFVIHKKEIVEDFQFWKKVMSESHVNMYHAIDENIFQEQAALLIKALPKKVNQQQAIMFFGKIAALLNEGHLGLPAAKYADSLYTQSERFPFLLKTVSEKTLEVDQDLSRKGILARGTKIVSVNNRKVAELNKQFKSYFGGLDHWKLQQVGTYVRKLLFLHEIKSPFRITAITPEGKKIQYTVKGYNKQEADSLNKVLAQQNSMRVMPYQFEWRQDSIAYIQYNNMTTLNNRPFSRFLDSSFSVIRNQKAKGLIIDIRENGGGNSALAEMMIPYFSNKAYRLSAGMKWKVSEHYKLFMKGSLGENAGPSFYFALPNDSIYHYQVKELQQPLENSLRFSGKTALLIGPNTFSSANMFSDGIRTYELAKVFGEPTGEPGNDYGEMFNFMLPNSRIIARAPSKMFTRADGDEKNQAPILPHVLVKPELNKDAAFEAARKWIIHQD